MIISMIECQTKQEKHLKVNGTEKLSQQFTNDTNMPLLKKTNLQQVMKQI